MINSTSKPYRFADLIEEIIVVILKWMFMVKYSFVNKKLWIINKKINYGCKNEA